MPKLKIKVESNDVETVVPIIKNETVSVEEPVKNEWPESGLRGRFHMVAWKEGYVVFNPQCQRITEVVSLEKATDIVRDCNIRGGIKVRK